MRTAILLCQFVVFGYITKAQFTILPQIGFENSRTSLRFNEGSSFYPAGSKISPQAGVRLDYKNKMGHGAFLGIASSRSVINFSFSDPQTGMSSYKASAGNIQLRLEGGYQASTKPIYFKKSGSANQNENVQVRKSNGGRMCGSSAVKKSCGNKANKVNAVKSIEKGSWVRIQPSVGLAFMPFTPSGEVYSKNQSGVVSYNYNAGNWKTAVTGGVGFEFGNNSHRAFTISLNYLKGISNMNTTSFSTLSASKPTSTSLQSGSSSWNLRMGFPVSLSKRKTATTSPRIYKEEKKCGQYRIQYRTKCTRVI